jgi:hypothetical protein
MVPFTFFEVLMAVQLSFLRSGVIFNDMFHHMLSFAESEELVMLAQIRKAWQSNERPDLRDLVGVTYFRVLATDPKDRFYALLGMVPEEDNQELIPDYTIATEEVFQVPRCPAAG